MRLRTFASPALLLAALMIAPAAAAQTAPATPTADDDTAASEAKPAGEDEAAELTAELAAPKAADDDAFSPHDPREKPGQTYYFIGARWRQTLLPKFMLGLFVSGGPTTVWIPSFGIEGTMRKDSFDTTLYLTYADWSMAPFAFKGKDEAPTAWEIVESRLKLLNFGVDLLWGTDFNPNFSFQYGITAGLSAVFGELSRVQGRPKAGTNDPNNPDNIERCPGPIPGGQPGATYCTGENNHYGDYTEKSWFNGGKKPNLYASFGPQIGFRFKPVKEFAARLNIGWDLFAGPFFGLNGSYGL